MENSEEKIMTGYYWYYKGWAFKTEQKNISKYAKEKGESTREAIFNTIEDAVDQMTNYRINKDSKISLSVHTLETLRNKINDEIEAENQLLAGLGWKDTKIGKLKENDDGNALAVSIAGINVAEIIGAADIKQMVSLFRDSRFRTEVGGRYSTLSYTRLGKGERDKGKKKANDVMTDLIKDFQAQNILQGTVQSSGPKWEQFLNLVFGLTPKEIEAFQNSLDTSVQQAINDVLAEQLQKVLLASTVDSKGNFKISTSEKVVKDAYKNITFYLQSMAKDWMGKLENKKNALEDALKKMEKEDLFPIEGSLAAGKIVGSYNNANYSAFVQTSLTLIEEAKGKTDEEAAPERDKIRDNFWKIIVDSANKIKLNTNNFLYNEKIKERFVKAFNNIFNSIEKIKALEAYGPGQITGVLDELAGALELITTKDRKISEIEIIGRKKLSDSAQGNVDITFKLGNKTYGVQTKNYSKSTPESITLYNDTSFRIMSNDSERYIDEGLLKTLRFLIANGHIIDEYSSDFNNKSFKSLIPDMESALYSALPALIRQNLVKNKLDKNILTTNTIYILNGRYFLASYLLIKLYQNAKAWLEKAEKDSKMITLTGDFPKKYSGYVGVNFIPTKWRQQAGAGNFKSIQYNNKWLPRNLEYAQSNIRLNFKGLKVDLG